MAKPITHYSNKNIVDFPDDLSPVEADSIIIEVAASIMQGDDETKWDNQIVENRALVLWAAQFMET